MSNIQVVVRVVVIELLDYKISKTYTTIASATSGATVLL